MYIDALVSSQHATTSPLLPQLTLPGCSSHPPPAVGINGRLCPRPLVDDGPVPAAEPVAAQPPVPAAPNDAATPSRRRAPEASGRRAKKPRVAASRVKDVAAADGGAGVAGDASGRWFRPGQAVVTCESSEDEEHNEETDEEDAGQLRDVWKEVV